MEKGEFLLVCSVERNSLIEGMHLLGEGPTYSFSTREKAEKALKDYKEMYGGKCWIVQVV